MTDAQFADFFNAVAPRLGLRAAGYRRVRGTVRKRLARRLTELGLDLSGYARHLEANPAEWQWLEASCRITISRFGRDAPVFEQLAARVLPERAAAAQSSGQASLRIWSAGCASGEEAYAVAIAFRICVAPRHPGLGLEVLGTDLAPAVLARARRGGYPPGCLRELPPALRTAAFERRQGECFVLPSYRHGVRFELADLRGAAPPGLFDVVSCRNVAFTYFATGLQQRVAGVLAGALRPGGVLIVGAGEAVPEGSAGLVAGEPCFYTRTGDLRAERGP